MSIKNFVIKSRAYLTVVRNLTEGVVNKIHGKLWLTLKTPTKMSPKNCYSIYSSKNLLLRT